MSIVIQIGQCGNQLGEAVFSKLYEETIESKEESLHKFSRQFFHSVQGLDRPVANAITVDMEPKVIDQLLDSNKKAKYAYSNFNTYTKQEGSGNNWAYGYYKHGPQCEDDIYKKVRSLGERVDNFSNVIFIQSLAGGTGSGLGSSILYRLKDEFPDIFFTNFLVVPKIGGEVILQNYNSVFSMASIYQNTDAICLLQNDQANAVCKNIFGLKNIDMGSINAVLSKNIVSTLLVDNPDYDNENSDFKDVIQQNLIPYQHAKLIGNRFIPTIKDEHKDFMNDTWKALTGRACQTLINGGTEAKINWNMKANISPNVNKSLAVYMDCNSKKDPIDVKEFASKDFPFNTPYIYHKDVKKPNFKACSRKLIRFQKCLRSEQKPNAVIKLARVQPCSSKYI